MKFFIEGEKSKAICDDCKELVAENYQRFKHMFQSKNEKKPKSVKWIDGLYSLKRLSS